MVFFFFSLLLFYSFFTSLPVFWHAPSAFAGGGLYSSLFFALLFSFSGISLRFSLSQWLGMAGALGLFLWVKVWLSFPVLAGGGRRKFSPADSRASSPGSLVESSQSSSPEPFSRESSPGLFLDASPSGLLSGPSDGEAFVRGYCQRFYVRGLFAEETPVQGLGEIWFRLPKFWSPPVFSTVSPGAGGFQSAFFPEAFLGTLFPRPLRPAGRLLDLALARIWEQPPCQVGRGGLLRNLGEGISLSWEGQFGAILVLVSGVGLGLFVLGGVLLGGRCSALAGLGPLLRSGAPGLVVNLGSLPRTLDRRLGSGIRFLGLSPSSGGAAAPFDSPGKRPRGWSLGRQLFRGCGPGRFIAAHPSPLPRGLRPSLIASPGERAQVLALAEQRSLWTSYCTFSSQRGVLKLSRGAGAGKVTRVFSPETLLGQLHKKLPIGGDLGGLFPGNPRQNWYRLEVVPVVARSPGQRERVSRPSSELTPGANRALCDYISGLVDGDGSFSVSQPDKAKARLRGRASIVFVREDLALALFVQSRLPGAVLSLERFADATQRESLFVLRLRFSSKGALSQLVNEVLRGHSWNHVRFAALESLGKAFPRSFSPAIGPGVGPASFAGTIRGPLPPLNWFAGMMDADGYVGFIFKPGEAPQVTLEVESTRAENLAPFQRVFGGVINPKGSHKYRWSSSNAKALERYIHYSCQVPHFNFPKNQRLGLLPSFIALKELKAWKKGSSQRDCWLFFLQSVAFSGKAKANSAVFREIEEVQRELSSSPGLGGEGHTAVVEKLKQVRRRFSKPFSLEDSFEFKVSPRRK